MLRVLSILWLLSAAPALALEPELPPPELARLYFYRESEAMFIGLSPEIIVNGKSIGASEVDSAFFRDARPGRYQIFLSNDPENVVDFIVVGGEMHFLKVLFTVDDQGPRLKLQRVDPAYAINELRALTP